MLLAAIPFVVVLELRTPVRGQTYFLKIAGLSVFALYLLGRLVGRLEPHRLGIPDLALALSSAAIVLSALFSDVPAYALNAALPWFSGLALFLMLRSASRQADLFRLFSWIFVLQAGPLAAYGIAQHYGWEFLPYSELVQKNHVISTFGHPNFFGSYMGPLLFICLARALAPGFLPGRIYALAMVVCIAVALYLARCRAVWIGCVLGSGLTLALVLAGYIAPRIDRFSRDARRLLAGAAAGAAVLGLILIATAASAHSVRAKLGSLVSGSQWETRIYYWYVASSLHSPFSPIGIGTGGFGRRFWDQVDATQRSPEGRYFTRNVAAMAGARTTLDPGNVHNDYLELWAESGPFALFGHLLFVAFLVYFGVARLLRSPSPMHAALLGGFACMLFDGMLGFPLALPCSLALFWFYGAMLNQLIERPV